MDDDKEPIAKMTWERAVREAEQALAQDVEEPESVITPESLGFNEIVQLKDGTRVTMAMADIYMMHLESYARLFPMSFRNTYQAAVEGKPFEEALLIQAEIHPAESELIRPLLINGVQDTPEGLVVGNPFRRDKQGRLPEPGFTGIMRQWADRLRMEAVWDRSNRKGPPEDDDRGPSR